MRALACGRRCQQVHHVEGRDVRSAGHLEPVGHGGSVRVRRVSPGAPGKPHDTPMTTACRRVSPVSRGNPQRAGQPDGRRTTPRRAGSRSSSPCRPGPGWRRTHRRRRDRSTTESSGRTTSPSTDTRMPPRVKPAYIALPSRRSKTAHGPVPCGDEPLGALVEVEVLAGGGHLVVAVQRLRDRAGGQLEGRLQLLDRLVAVDQRHQRELGVLDVLAVDDQVRRVVGLLHHELRRARVVAVLRDEALPVLVDQDPADQRGRRVDRRRDERLLHVLELRADRLAEADAEPVVVRRAQGEELGAERRACTSRPCRGSSRSHRPRR